MVIIALRPISNTTIVIGFGKIWFQGNRFVVVLDGMVMIALHPISNTTIVIGSGNVQFQANRFIEILDGSGKLTFLSVSNTTIVGFYCLFRLAQHEQEVALL